jgi:putative DNA primase/helicase
LSSDEIMDALDANEDGDAIFFIRLHQGRFAYDHSGGCWHVFRDHHWHEDTTDQTVAALQNVIELYGVEAEKQAKCRLEAEKAGQKEQAGQHETLEEALLKRIRQLQGLKRKMDVLRLAAIDWSAQGRPSLALTGEEWDRHPMLLGCSNGVIDLTSGEHRPGRPTDYIKTFAPTPWLGLDAPAPLWAKFLAEIFAGDQEIISYIQRLLGYGITGRTTELIFPIFHGPHGRNGKGTLLETLRHVLGDFAAPIEAEMLLLQNHPRQSGAPASDIMALRGKRLVWASETGDGRRLDVGKVKWVTGGDTMTGRAPYGRRQVNFPPTHKVILLTNHKPHAPANDDALWVRLHLIPFNVSFVDNPTKPNERPRNPSLPEDLKGEASGILGWLVQGSLLWQKEGLRPPKTVLTATESYRKDEDLVGNFLSECCIEDENAEAPAGKLYTAYQKWCTEMGHKPMSGTKFGIDMKERFDSYGDRRGIFYMGLGLRERDFTEEGD